MTRNTTATGPINYVWDVAGGLPRLLSDGTKTYVYGDRLLYTVDGTGAAQAGTPTWLFGDKIGSTATLMNAAGVVTGSYTYDVFGAAKTQTGAATEFSFTGEQNDPNGLEFLRARYYDPSTGRFLSRDTHKASKFLVGSQNRYVYVGNNPVNAVDPSGECICPLENLEAGADFVSSVISSGGQSAASFIGSAMSSSGANHLADAVSTVAAYAPEALDSALALAAVGPYAAYFVAYQELEFLDSVHDELGYAYDVIAAGTGLDDLYTGLQVVAVLGLAGDVAIDILRGENIGDEGHYGSIIPDDIQKLLGNPDPQAHPTCPCTYLPGVHPGGQVDIPGVPNVGMTIGELFDFFFG